MKRPKEIEIRRVNGAKGMEIFIMLNKDIIRWVTIAFIIATPITYYFSQKWLQTFAFRTTISWWIFVLASALTLGISLLTVSWQSRRTATRNPLKVLRHE